MKTSAFISLLVLAAALFVNGVYHLVKYYEGKARFEVEQRCKADIKKIIAQSKQLNACIEAFEALQGQGK